MLTAELNAALTQVGSGTPMGEMMRRYWFPVAFVADLDEFPVKKVRLLGEDFAVYKMPSGRYGIIQEACPHRRASLAYGIVEEDGIRCSSTPSREMLARLVSIQVGRPSNRCASPTWKRGRCTTR